MRAARWYGLLAALLFLAFCAWLAAALFSPPAAQAQTAPEAHAAPARLRGVVLRRELAPDAGELPADAEDGKRLSAAETGRESGLYFAAGDGFAALAPEEAQPFSAARTEALLAAAPEVSTGPRLVTVNAVWVAALVEGGGTPEVGGRCSVRFDGADGPFEALVEAADGDAVLLRITEGLDFLCRVRFVTGEIETL